MKTILIATDFSEHSTVALQTAARLARAHGARLHAVHVIDWLTSWWSPMRISDDFLERVEREARERIDDGLSEFERNGMTVSSSSGVGKAWEVILETADEIDCDLLVIGTRGLGALPNALLGSTAERVLELSTRPVVSVHGEQPAFDAAVERLVLPTDLALEIEGPLEAALALQADGNRPVVVLVHALHLPEFYWRTLGRHDLSSALEGMLETAREHLEEAADELRSEGYEVTVVVERGDPARLTSEVAEREGAELIALHNKGATRKHRFLLGKTARRLLQLATVPVLTIPPPATAD